MLENGGSTGLQRDPAARVHVQFGGKAAADEADPDFRHAARSRAEKVIQRIQLMV